MKRYITAILVLIISASGLAAAELKANFDIGNIDFSPTPLSSNSFPGTTFPFGFDISYSYDADEAMSLQFGLNRDAVLRNRAYTLFSYDGGLFRIGVGPYFGLFNTAGSVLKSGISTSIHLEAPGIVFIDFRSDSTISARLAAAGDYMQENSDVSVGFFVYNALCSLRLHTQSFVEVTTAYGTVTDSLTEYTFESNIFKKNVPYTILLKLGYQTRQKTWDDTNNKSQQLNSIILGTKFNLDVTPDFTLIVGLDSNLYSFGFYNDGTQIQLMDFATTFPGVYLFKAELGFTYSF